MEEEIKDSELKEVFEGTVFSEHLNERQRVNQALLKRACGYWEGGTMNAILQDLELIHESESDGLTVKGQHYLYDQYNSSHSLTKDQPNEEEICPTCRKGKDVEFNICSNSWHKSDNNKVSAEKFFNDGTHSEFYHKGVGYIPILDAIELMEEYKALKQK